SGFPRRVGGVPFTYWGRLPYKSGMPPLPKCFLSPWSAALNGWVCPPPPLSGGGMAARPPATLGTAVGQAPGTFAGLRGLMRSEAGYRRWRIASAGGSRPEGPAPGWGRGRSIGAMTTPRDVLAGVPLFSMLPKKEVAKLARRAHELTVPAGTVVTDVDRAGVSFGVIVNGQAAVSVHGQPVRVLGPGDYFGEMALIDESARYRSAKIT